MKKLITPILTALLLVCSVTAFTQKLPKRESVHIPRGRSITMQARINRLGHAYGTVTVDFKIDRKGNVIWAAADRLHTTVMDRHFIQRVVDAVRDMKFNKNRRAPVSQDGKISYSFR